MTRAASRGDEPMASCTATTGAADECDLIRKTLGRRIASKAVQVCVAGRLCGRAAEREWWLMLLPAPMAALPSC